MKDSVFVYSMFEVDPHGHGGCRRTSQIDELIQRGGFNSVQSGIKKLFSIVYIKLKHTKMYRSAIGVMNCLNQLKINRLRSCAALQKKETQ